MAILVIGIHTHPLEYVENEIFKLGFSLLSSCAVPFFFMTTGYLLMRKLHLRLLNDKLQIIKGTIIKTGKVYILWSVAYLPLKIILAYEYQSYWGKALLGYIRDCFSFGSYFVLWYLLSAFYALIFIYYMISRRNTVINIVIYAFVIYCFGKMFDAFLAFEGSFPQFVIKLRDALAMIFVSGRLTSGFLYITLGMLVYEYYIKLADKKLYVSLFFAGIVEFFVAHYYDIPVDFFGTLLCVVGIFVLTLSIELDNSKLYLQCRTMSVVMYFMHMWVLSVYSYCSNGAVHIYVRGMQSFAIVSSVCFILSVIWMIRFKLMRIPVMTFYKSRR